MLNDHHYLESAARQHVDQLLAEAQAERLFASQRAERAEQERPAAQSRRRGSVLFAIIVDRLARRPAHSH